MSTLKSRRIYDEYTTNTIKLKIINPHPNTYHIKSHLSIGAAISSFSSYVLIPIFASLLSPLELPLLTEYLGIPSLFKSCILLPYLSNGIVCRFCFGNNCCKFDLFFELSLLFVEERFVVDLTAILPCLIAPPEVKEVVAGIVNDVQLDIMPPRRQHSRSFIIVVAN